MKTTVCYVQKSASGYLCDSDWDGDVFCSDPRRAIRRLEPWQEGRGGQMYACVKITLIEHDSHIPMTVQLKDRWEGYCQRCGARTKRYVTLEKAAEAYNKLGPCVTAQA